MHRIFDVERDRFRATLRTGPERLSGRSLLIRREVEQQLADLVVILLLEMDARPFDTILEALRSLVDQSGLEVEVLHCSLILSHFSRRIFTLTDSNTSSGCTPGNLSVRSMKVGSETY